MSATSKTKKLRREDVPVSQLLKNAHNPNKMKPRAFDLLVDNIQQTGITDPILVRPVDDDADGDPQYRIVGGHHRFEAAIYLGFTEVPCTIIDDPDFDDDAEKFQLVRMNMIHGDLDASAFMQLASDVMGKYGDDVLQDAFGISDDAVWAKLVNQTAKQLPDVEMQKKFKQAAKEIKTVDGLAQLLNEMFTKFGSTLETGYMMFDFNNQRSVWLQASKKTINSISTIGDICVENERTIDDVLGRLVQMLAAGELKEVLGTILKNTPAVAAPQNLQKLPTKDNMAEAIKLAAPKPKLKIKSSKAA